LPLQVVDDCNNAGGIGISWPAQQGAVQRSGVAGPGLAGSGGSGGSHSIAIPHDSSSTLAQEQQRPAAARGGLWGIQPWGSSAELHESLL
jgi:hypothetical protein